jgi:hypothetical protein
VPREKEKVPCGLCCDCLVSYRNVGPGEFVTSRADRRGRESGNIRKPPCSPTMAHSKFSSWNSLKTRMISRSHGLRFESGCSSSLSSPVCVSCPCPNTFFAELEFTGYPVAFAMATGVFQANEGRSWTRSFHMAAMRYLLRQDWDIRMFRACLGLTTTEAYEQWARQEKQEVFTDILPEDAKLHWFGPRRDGPEGRVLLFFYGASQVSFILAHSLIGHQTCYL